MRGGVEDKIIRVIMFFHKIGQGAEEAEGGVGIHVGVTLKVVDEV